jgi:hypothetical protein
MVRKQVSLEARQDAWPPDPRAWAEARAVIVRRLKMTAPQTGRAWTRDELYEDRLGRGAPGDG